VKISQLTELSIILQKQKLAKSFQIREAGFQQDIKTPRKELKITTQHFNEIQGV